VGLGFWFVGLGVWGLGQIPNPQSPKIKIYKNNLKYKLNNLKFLLILITLIINNY